MITLAISRHIPKFKAIAPLGAIPAHGWNISVTWFLIFVLLFIKPFTLCYQTVLLSVLSCLSVTFVYCGQTVEWIKVKLGMQVGLGHIVLDADLALPTKGAQQPPRLKFRGAGFACVRIIRGPCLLWPNGWMGKNAIWYGGSVRRRRENVDSSSKSNPLRCRRKKLRRVDVTAVVVSSKKKIKSPQIFNKN